MSIHANPTPGQLLMCDFGTSFIPPEMTKKRPVVVVSIKRRHERTCTVIPLSTAIPESPQPYHHQMSPLSLPGKLKNDETWAKCDMVTTVSYDRLDRIKIGRDAQGKRLYVSPLIALDDLVAIKEGVRFWLNL